MLAIGRPVPMSSKSIEARQNDWALLQKGTSNKSAHCGWRRARNSALRCCWMCQCVSVANCRNGNPSNTYNESCVSLVTTLCPGCNENRAEFSGRGKLNCCSGASGVIRRMSQTLSLASHELVISRFSLLGCKSSSLTWAACIEWNWPEPWMSEGQKSAWLEKSGNDAVGLMNVKHRSKQNKQKGDKP